EERRERERAREARRVATARNNARRGRNDLADEFSDPQSAIDRLPDEPRTDNRERRREEANEPLPSAESGENSSELSDEAPPPTVLLPPDDDSQESPNESTNTVADSQDSTEQESSEDESPLVSDGEEDVDETPAPQPSPPPAQPSGDNNFQCQRLLPEFGDSTQRLMTLFSQFQAAAASEDEERAQRLACDAMEESDRILGLFSEYEGAQCPIQGDVTNLRATLNSIRSGLQQGLKRDCGVSSAPANDFAGTWTSSVRCPGAYGDAATRWSISLQQAGSEVSGKIAFHRCPGGGRATYNVTGIAGSGEVVTLNGTLIDSRGPLADTASRNVTFSVRKNAAPEPNIAP
ncbi:MAG: hypothetical protein AAF662_13755, partial [Pseudomonadota bacterium]